MTALVGIYCKDGVVIGADSAATSAAGQIRTIEQPTEKIDVIRDQIIVAGTGSVGLAQRFSRDVQNLHEGNHLKGDELQFAKIITAEAIKDFSSTQVAKGQFGALVAYVCKGKHRLAEFSEADLQPEMKNDRLWYVSMGSGQLIADPFLAFIRSVFWKDGPPTVQDAVFAATWTLDHAVEVNPGGINGPVRIAVLEKTKQGAFMARMLTEDELLEHRTGIESAKSALRSYKATMQSGACAPDLPAPPPSQAPVAPAEAVSASPQMAEPARRA